MTRWTRCDSSLFHQVSGGGLPGEGALHIAAPTHDIDAQLLALPQALHQPLRPFAGSQNVDFLLHEGLLHQPAVSGAPSDQSQGQKNKPKQRGVVARQNIWEKIAD